MVKSKNKNRKSKSKIEISAATTPASPQPVGLPQSVQLDRQRRALAEVESLKRRLAIQAAARQSAPGPDDLPALAHVEAVDGGPGIYIEVAGATVGVRCGDLYAVDLRIFASVILAGEEVRAIVRAGTDALNAARARCLATGGCIHIEADGTIVEWTAAQWAKHRVVGRFSRD